MAADAAVAAVFEPVQTPTTFEETVDRLGTAIRLGLLAPGSRLPSERDLAGRLAISRSTLHQAITALVESGHVRSLRGRRGGTFVVAEPPLAECSPGPMPDDGPIVSVKACPPRRDTPSSADSSLSRPSRSIAVLLTAIFSTPAATSRRACARVRIPPP